MAVVTHPNPVVVSHPITQQFVTLAKGMEYPDDDPVVREFAWAFAAPVESATAAPGEKRSVRKQ